VQLATRASVDWSQYGPLLTCEHLATIYTAYALRTIRNLVAARSPKLPTPCGTRPFVFRKADVIRHFERMEA
jgi:hypothetical protein